MPLPPYIERASERKADLEDYQSVFARAPGAVAAPTASLHFTPELAARLPIAALTLHVGPGTFKPLRSERVEDHVIEGERYEVPVETAAAIARAKAAGGRVIAVGTTVVRALETSGGAAGPGTSELLITPGYRFRVVDSIVTNFHLPRTSLLALVMAFGGVEPVRRAYAHAVARGFRFYSYGDAMWLV
jgi:S-adenosylmethionine:tRNA ribosyltransferase-isomerase